MQRGGGKRTWFARGVGNKREKRIILRGKRALWLNLLDLKPLALALITDLTPFIMLASSAVDVQLLFSVVLSRLVTAVTTDSPVPYVLPCLNYQCEHKNQLQ